MALIKLGNLACKKNDSIYRLKIDFLNVADTRFDNVNAETEKNGIPRIGSKLLNYGAVTLDFVHDKFYFDSEKPENDLNEKMWPFSPVIIDHKLVVGVVWGKLKDQISLGQQIIAINNKDYQKVNLYDWILSKSIFDDREKIILTIKDENGKIKNVQVVKE